MDVIVSGFTGKVCIESGGQKVCSPNSEKTTHASSYGRYLESLKESGCDDFVDFQLDEEDDDLKEHSDQNENSRCENAACLLKLPVPPANFFCYFCSIFLCSECLTKHDQRHACNELGSSSVQTKNKNLLPGDPKRKKKGDRLEKMIRISGRIYMKHELDEKPCRITGICSLHGRRWGALDNKNLSLKIFSCDTNVLLRILIFGSRPLCATEMSTEMVPFSISPSNSKMRGLEVDHKTQRLVAVAFERTGEIWLMDLSKTPAVRNLKIRMNKICSDLDSNNGKLFVLCEEGVGNEPYSVTILSSNGEFLRTHLLSLNFPPHTFYSGLKIAVFGERIYMSIWSQDKVLCFDSENGNTISEATIEMSRPQGICADNSGNVYIGAEGLNKVYKMSQDLSRFEELKVDSEFTVAILAMCYDSGKLYCSNSNLTREEIVNVLQIA